MKIIYRQNPLDKAFGDIGIQNCCMKHSSYHKRAKDATTKEHHHTGFEIHIIENGHQSYLFNGTECVVPAGHYLLIPPNLKHCLKDVSPLLKKFAITFQADETSPFSAITSYVSGNLSSLITDALKKISLEEQSHLFYAERLIENNIFDILIYFLRDCGFKEAKKDDAFPQEDARLFIAKQYIKDNIESNLKVADIAAYCYLGTKQLTRLFQENADTTPAAYIQKQKIKHIEKLLTETDISLRDISEKMNFSSEYHLNSFFKKYAGMPPGEYRKMVK